MWRQRCREEDRQIEPQGQERERERWRGGTEKQSEQARQRCDGRGRHLSMSGHVLLETIGSGEGQSGEGVKVGKYYMCTECADSRWVNKSAKSTAA